MRHVDHGVFAVGEEGAIETRLNALHAALARAIEAHRPDVVAIEEVFHARNSRSAIVLGQARGVALLAAAICGVLRGYDGALAGAPAAVRAGGRRSVRGVR